jgi:hypothetical protein
VLKFGKLFEASGDEQWKTALNYLNTIPELNYLTQIVIMLYEDPNVEANSDKRFHIELHFSPGAYADFDVPQYLVKPGPAPGRTSVSSNEEGSAGGGRLNSSNGLNISDPVVTTSGSATTSAQRIQRPFKSSLRDRKSPVKSIVTRKLPFRLFNAKELQTLPEPNEMSNSFESQKNNESDESMSGAQANDDAKPRSFEDEHHQRRMLEMKIKINTAKELYNHYNTFHGSGNTSNYLSLAQVFRNRTTSFGTNSSPDLNNTLVGGKVVKKSLPSNK